MAVLHNITLYKIYNTQKCNKIKNSKCLCPLIFDLKLTFSIKRNLIELWDYFLDKLFYYNCIRKTFKII